ncbi:3466_t:CDS:2 [Scutellospora calospora]|uniref:3466_t:CDS:1 n=1 Tax=Scutellospora calospora TaxID=85575 RepID=A0ACA9K0F6_9GLOM|nr:3466_t:CDS:2 [Scutellospora calospora]
MSLLSLACSELKRRSNSQRTTCYSRKAEELLRNIGKKINKAIPFFIILFLINTIIFIMWLLLPQSFMQKYFVHHPQSGYMFTLLTSIFSHESAWHYCLNMLGLCFFGGIVYSTFGREQFLAFYLSSGVISSYVNHILSLMLKNQEDIKGSFGASSTVYACLGAFFGLFWNYEASLTIKFKYSFPVLDLYGAIVGLGVLYPLILFDEEYFARFVGAMFGLLYVKYGRDQYQKFEETIKTS